jgi:hypothetical protein
MPKLYTWEQTQSEVRIFVPIIDGDFNFKRDVKYTVKNSREISLTVAGKTYMDGKLGGPVDQDMAEMACSVHEENGVKGLEVQLEKQMPIPWKHCIEGEDPDEAPPVAAAPAPAAAGAATAAAAAAAAAAAPSASKAKSPKKSPTKKAGSVGFTEAAMKPPPPATRPPAAAVAAATAAADGAGGGGAGGSSVCMMCMMAGTVLGVVGYAVDHWQKNTL